MTDAETEKYLAKIAALMVAFKDRPLLDYMARVVSVAVAHGEVWPDCVSKVGIREEDKNCIGIAFRLLKAAGLVRRTDSFRRSEADDAHGRTIWKYELVSRALAETFLKRHGELPPVGQMKLELNHQDTKAQSL
jgi:hypothetical protein